MSMIISLIDGLIDELNKSADEWNGSNMFELARMCREAADTITELRGALHVASVNYRLLEAENAKLRELLRVAYNCTNAGPSCLECRIVAGGCTLLSAMHELGVVK